MQRFPMRIVVIGVLTAIAALGEGGGAKIEPIGIGNLKRYVSDLDKSFALYRDVFGLQANGEPGKFAVNPQGQKATNTPGAKYRVAFFNLPGASYRLELVEYADIAHEMKPMRRQADIGDQALDLQVRDLDGTLARAKQAGLKIVTVGGEPILRTNANNNSSSRAITFRDPDGFLVEIQQTTPLPETDVPMTANVVRANTDMTVENLDKAVAFYRDVLGLEMATPGQPQRNELTMKVIGNETATEHPSFRGSAISIGGKRTGLSLLEFTGVSHKKPDFRPQDPGSCGFSLAVKDEAVAGKVLKEAGATILTVGGEPQMNPNGGGLMYIKDLDGIIIEVSQPGPGKK